MPAMAEVHLSGGEVAVAMPIAEREKFRMMSGRKIARRVGSGWISSGLAR
jgi:hypothetical protein